MSEPRALLLCERLDVAGGVERFVCALANHLATLGFGVAVGSVATPCAAVRYPLHPAVRVLHGSEALPQGDGALARLRRQWRTGRVLSDLIRQHAPEVIVLNGLTTACSVLALHRGDRKRIVCCDHNHFGARSRLWQRLRRRLYGEVGAVVSLTQADASRFGALNVRTEVIANASELTAEAPVGVAAPVVLAVGRHVAQKGLDLLLRAWPAVQAQLPAARLRIVGDGPLTASLQAQARAAGVGSSVDWVPPTDDIRAEYARAAVFVLPSRYEGMPLALLEAQALGLPAVAFDCPTGPREIVGSDPVTGLVVPAGDVGGLAAALVQLLADPALRARMGAAAIERSRQHFSLALHRQRWASLLRRVAAAAPAPIYEGVERG
jgi:glycosyltransferase involved in cell wall biosynthesis